MRKWFVIKITFFLLFAGHFCATNLFSHTHIVNGHKIAHSHPYQGGHTHDTDEYKLIQNLNHSSFLYLPIDISFQTFEIKLQKKKFYYWKNNIYQKLRDYPRRGPPCPV